MVPASVLLLGLTSLVSSTSATKGSFSKITQNDVDTGHCNSLDYYRVTKTKLSCLTGLTEWQLADLDELSEGIEVEEKVQECASAEEVCGTSLEVVKAQIAIGNVKRTETLVRNCPEPRVCNMTLCQIMLKKHNKQSFETSNDLLFFLIPSIRQNFVKIQLFYLLSTLVN